MFFLKQNRKFLIGVVHLKALPGSPNFNNDFDSIEKGMINDINAYLEGKVDAIILENYFDIPFYKDSVPSEVIASMTRLTHVAKITINKKALLGVNILRNASIDAMAVAKIVNADFIRVNVLTGAMLTDQGIIETNAANLLRYRKSLAVYPKNIEIIADVQVKHAVPVAERTLTAEIKDTIHRSCAEGIIVSGEATGDPPSLKILKEAAKIINSEVPLIIGSGTTLSNIKEFLPYTDAFIIGTAMKTDGKVDSSKVKKFSEIIHSYND